MKLFTMEEKFEKTFNKLQKYNNRLGCYNLKKSHEIKERDSLSYILNDNRVEKEGMHLVAIY